MARRQRVCRTIDIAIETDLPPQVVLDAAHDFSMPRRSLIFNAVQPKYFIVHALRDGTADVTEGTRAGLIVNWERCDYDWSQPGKVTAIVKDSNIYAIPGSTWELNATRVDGRTGVHLIWTRAFNRRPKGLFFSFAYRTFGEKLFGTYAREIIKGLEKLESKPAAA
jgi:hypothetical protein